MTLVRRIKQRVPNDCFCICSIFISQSAHSLFILYHIFQNICFYQFSIASINQNGTNGVQLMVLIKSKQFIQNRQNKIFMQMRSVSPRHFPSEQEYNFRVKVNYNNGAISVHGPPNYNQPPIPQMSIPQHPMSYVPSISSPQHMPVFRQSLPMNQNYLRYSPSFSASTASHSQFPENQGIKNFKTYSDSFTEGPSMEKMSVQRHRLSQPLFKTEVENERKIILDSRQEQQIDCVICEKKFKPKDFDYHLQLHRNSRRKTEEVPATNQSLVQKNQKPAHNTSYQQIKPELLYSFHNQNNLQSSIREQQSFRSQRSLNMVQVNQLILNPSHNSSMISNNDSRNSSTMRNQIVNQQLQSGIRYLPPQVPSQLPQPTNVQILNNSIMSQNSRANSVQQPVMLSSGHIPPQIIYGSQHSHPSVSSVRSSQVFSPQMISNPDIRTSQSSMPKQNFEPLPFQQVIANTSQPSKGSKQQSVNPFQLIEQEQSKIYEYFPNSGHYSLSQHRVNLDPAPINNVSYQFPQAEEKKIVSPQRQSLRNSNQPKLIKNIRKNMMMNNEEQEACSRISHSSISSIRSLTQPLEDMSKEKIIRTFHNPKSKIDLSNIIGMSEVLARQGITNHANTIKQHQSIQNNNINNINRSSYNQFKVITAKSMILSPQSQQNYQSYIPNKEPQNIETQAIQNRQIYRGTQVQEDDLRDMMNITRSSKSSTKTKLPRNYLAVNDFINSSSTQRRPI